MSIIPLLDPQSYATQSTHEHRRTVDKGGCKLTSKTTQTPNKSGPNPSTLRQTMPSCPGLPSSCSSPSSALPSADLSTPSPVRRSVGLPASGVVFPSSRTRSYIPQVLPLNALEFDYCRRKTEGLSDPDACLWVHILLSNFRQFEEHPDGSPVPWETIQRYAPGAKGPGLPYIHFGGYRPGHCREYRIWDELLSEFAGLTSGLSITDYLSLPRFDFRSGRRIKGRLRSRTTTETNNKAPESIKQAIEIFDRNGSDCWFAEALAYEGNCETRKNEALLRYGDASEEYKTAQRRWFNAHWTVRNLYQFQPQPHSSVDGVWHISPAYKAVGSRIYVKGGGPQTASKALKAVLYNGVPGLTNWDAKASQVFITARLVEQVGLNADWLYDYAERDGARAEYAFAVGVSEDDFKQIIISLCMGAHLPKKTNHAEERDNSILKTLARSATDDAHLTSLLKQLRKIVAPLAGVLKQWHQHLLTDYLDKHLQRGGHLPNAVGKFLSLQKRRSELKDPRKKWKVAAEVAAHLLQGLEQAVVQQTIVDGDAIGIKFTAPEHDGFLAKIPNGLESQFKEMWKQNAARHGLAGLALKEKPFPYPTDWGMERRAA